MLPNLSECVGVCTCTTRWRRFGHTHHRGTASSDGTCKGQPSNTSTRMAKGRVKQHSTYLTINVSENMYGKSWQEIYMAVNMA